MSTTTQETSWINILHSETLCLGAQSCPTLCDPVDYSPPGSSVHGDSPAKNTGLGCHALLQGIFPTQGLNPDLLQCRQILYWLSHQGSSRILEWVAYPFSKGSSPPRNWTRVSCIAGRFFTSWATRETPMRHSVQFSSVQSLSHVWLCDPMNRSTPGLPVHHQLPEFTEIHAHWVSDAMQPFHLLSSPSPPAPNPSQHQGLFQWVNSSPKWPKYWSFSFSISPSNKHPGLISFRMDWLDLLAVQGTLKSLL